MLKNVQNSFVFFFFFIFYRESLRRGWELMAICLNFFPPSPKFQSYLEGYMNRHRDPGFDFPEVVKWPIHVQISHYATVSCKRLERIGTNGKKPPRKPTIEEIDQARVFTVYFDLRTRDVKKLPSF